MKRALLYLLFSGAMLASPSWGQQPADLPTSEAAIRTAAASYAAAFNKHDAKALAPVAETGLSNLTQDAAPALIHFTDGQTQQWLMVRIPEPTT